MSQRELRLTAYHEAGHTLVSIHAGSMNKLRKVTIMPRGNAYLVPFISLKTMNTTTRKILLKSQRQWVVRLLKSFPIW